jgi:hypothetical protein
MKQSNCPESYVSEILVNGIPAGARIITATDPGNETDCAITVTGYVDPVTGQLTIIDIKHG